MVSIDKNFRRQVCQSLPVPTEIPKKNNDHAGVVDPDILITYCFQGEHHQIE